MNVCIHVYFLSLPFLPPLCPLSPSPLPPPPQLQEVGESTPCSFRSLDARPGSYDIVAGTNRCEIWEITKEVRCGSGTTQRGRDKLPGRI